MKNRKAFVSAACAMFAAVICAGCFIRIPLGAVPVVIQNVLCILTSVILGGFTGCVPCALFLAAGFLGLPVYSGGTGGLAVWLGPTGGFLPGYFFGSLAAGLIAGKPCHKKSAVQKENHFPVSAVRVALALIAGMIIIYIPGTLRFAQWALASSKVPADKTAFAYTMAACDLPYIPGDIIKTMAAVPVALSVRPVLARYMQGTRAVKDNCSADDLRAAETLHDAAGAPHNEPALSGANSSQEKLALYTGQNLHDEPAEQTQK